MDSSCHFRISAKHQCVVMRYDIRVAQLIPHAKEVVKNGTKFLTTPHRDTETKLLNNLGYAVDAPILYHYDWGGTTPFMSQRDTARLLTENRRAYVLNDMGTGKTRASLFACDFLMDNEEIQSVLVVAPLSTLTTVWEREIFAYFPHRRAVALHGTKDKRLKLLAEPADFYIINHDGVGVLEEVLHARPDIDTIIIDEIAILRNSKTKRWKIMNRLCKSKKYVWGMTGGPMPKAPTDAYGQIKLLTPERVAGIYFTGFRSKTMLQITQFKWIPKKEANDIVHELMQPAVRYSREDCIDLPPTTYSTQEIALSNEQKKAYKQMQREFMLEHNGLEITAANAGVQASKLIQISSGFSYGSNGVVVELDCKTRLDTLTEILDGTQNKVIVFAPFKHTVRSLKAYLSLAGYFVERIDGDVTKTERDVIFNSFQHSSEPRVIVAHPQTMSHGLTLTAADTIVWYAPCWDLELYDQACARITRPGQVNHTHIIHIQASPVEKRVYNVLNKRGNMQQALLSLFKDGQRELF